MIGFGQKTGLYGTAGHEDGATAEEILSYNQQLNQCSQTEKQHGE